MNTPTAMTLAPDGRIFVCQQGGALRVIKNGERGLLGVAFSFDKSQRWRTSLGPDGTLFVAVGDKLF